MTSEDIILEIEGSLVTCNKKDLIENSDYFKAMLDGHFIESGKKSIKLEDVDLNAMHVILKLIWDNSYTIKNEDLLLVLEAACMLQFIEIKQKCIDLIVEMLSPKNCINIWIFTERLDIKPLCFKAKCMALEEFDELRDSESVLQLSLEKIIEYLGNINLKARSEIFVFQTAMQWWYENNNLEMKRNNDVLIKLLSLIDYKKMLLSEISEIVTYPDIAQNKEIFSILNIIISLKSSVRLENVVIREKEIAEKLLNCESRLDAHFPCLLLHQNEDESESKNPKHTEEVNYQVFHYDKFKRKRTYKIVEDEEAIDTLRILFYDTNRKQFKSFFNISKKCQNLNGFKLLGYKEYIFMFGGEFTIGKGDWNYNFWAFDTIRDRWERKSLLPFPRRHFQSCLVNNHLYIIGGTGVFRVIQENMFWYNYKQDKWSSQIILPCPGRQIKCCDFNDELFVLNINNKCGYFFKQDMGRWIKIEILDEQNVLGNISDFSLYSYDHKLYIKASISGIKVIELVVKDKQLSISNVENVKIALNFENIESVLCGSKLFTMYQHRCLDELKYSLEECDLISGSCSFIFKEKAHDKVTEIDDKQYSIESSLQLFSFKHYTLIEDSMLINNNFD